MSAAVPQAGESGARERQRRHLAFGWWCLLVFLTMGLTLEGLHGFRVGLYLDSSNEARRMLWTLAHAHGALLAVVNIVFALLVGRIAEPTVRLAARCLAGAAVLVPAGFFLAGLFLYQGEPGPAALIVPLAGLLLLAGVVMTALRTG